MAVNAPFKQSSKKKKKELTFDTLRYHNQHYCKTAKLNYSQLTENDLLRTKQELQCQLDVNFDVN